MRLLPFARPRTRTADPEPLVATASIEVMPRTAAKVEDFTAILAPGTRVYIAHIEGTPMDEMLATAKRLADSGFEVMPHFAARAIADAAELEEMIAAYQGEAGISSALLLAGGGTAPKGAFTSSMDMIETGLFDRAGFTRLHVAGHPEGNRDIDRDGSGTNVSAALAWKQAYSERTDAEMGITTQFAFEAEPVLDWAEEIAAAGITLPVHLGIAGPAKLQTLIRYAIACGVGPSLSVLQKRAMDVTKLLLPYTPDDLVTRIAAARAAGRAPNIEALHVFPLGGIAASAAWLAEAGGTGRPVRAEHR